LHADTFGVFLAAAIHLVHGFFVGRHLGRGQAIYYSLSFGLGGALGSLGAGWLWESMGGWQSFAIASIISIQAWAVVWRWMDVK
jgi:PPP family 3-phenylpropionic acid transporter